MKRPIRWYDYITFNAYYLGLTVISQTMAPLVLPLLVQRFVGETAKATYFGTLRLGGLMMALLAQALWGMLSDRSMSRWGRRRPFIFLGTLIDLIFIGGIIATARLSGLTGFWVLFAMYLLLQVSSNMAHGATQGIIPDLVPPELRGRFSGAKALLETPIPLILVSFTIARIISHGNMTGGILLMVGFLLLSMILTMLVPEEPLKERPTPLNWQPYLRLVLMTALFTVLILALGAAVKALGRQLPPALSPALLLGGMGAAGLVAMALAVAVGVWSSVQLSIGATQAKANPSFTWWVINRLAFLVGAFNLASFAVYFIQGRLQDTYEKAAAPASLMMTLVGVFILVFALPSGWLADKIGRKRVVALSGIVAAVGTLVLLLSPNLTVIYIGGCIIGAATGMFYTANWALGTSLVPKGEAGRYLGLSNLAGAGAGAVGAYIGGPIADLITGRLPQTPGLGYVLLFAIYGLLFLLSTVALIPVREPAPES